MHTHWSLFISYILIFLSDLSSGGPFPSRRSWWAKQVTDDLRVAGRLTETQMKLAKESGYKSFISLSRYADRDYIGPGTTDPLPSTQEAEDLTSLLGTTFTYLETTTNDSVQHLDVIREFTNVYSSVEKPVLFFSENGYSAGFVALMHNLNESNADPNATPKFDIEGFFTGGAALGYSYGRDSSLVSLIEELIGDSVNVTGWDAPVSIPDWYKLPASWQIKPLYKNIYVSGQVQSNHLDFIKQTYDVLANSRRGVTVQGQPSQEEVVLLNIRDRTNTYNTNGVPVRQTLSNLLTIRIDEDLPNTYIFPDSTVNFQQTNPLQFGDDVGYNETIERMMVEEKGLMYAHVPVGGEYTYTTGVWDAYRETLLSLGQRYNILLQCRSGYRSSAIGMLVYGCLHGHNSTEALERAHLYGYRFDENDPRVVDLARQVLDNREVACQCQTCVAETTTAEPEDTTTDATVSTSPALLGSHLLLLSLLSWNLRSLVYRI